MAGIDEGWFKNKYGKKFFHLGPDRDSSIFEKVKENKTNLNDCDFILCTGLFDEHEKNLDFYEDLLKKHTSKKLLCTNPDLIVHRGTQEEYCAGAIAKIFETLGGQVVYYGKPHKEIYKMCFDKGEKVLAIGAEGEDIANSLIHFNENEIIVAGYSDSRGDYFVENKGGKDIFWPFLNRFPE